MRDDIFGEERVELADLLSHVLDKGVVLKGEVMLAVADIDLVRLDIGLLLTAVESAMRRGGGGRPPLFGPVPGSPTSPPSEPSGDDQVVRALAPPRTASLAPLAEVADALPPRLDADPEKMENGLAKIVPPKV